MSHFCLSFFLELIPSHVYWAVHTKRQACREHIKPVVVETETNCDSDGLLPFPFSFCMSLLVDQQQEKDKHHHVPCTSFTEHVLSLFWGEYLFYLDRSRFLTSMQMEVTIQFWRDNHRMSLFVSCFDLSWRQHWDSLRSLPPTMSWQDRQSSSTVFFISFERKYHSIRYNHIRERERIFFFVVMWCVRRCVGLSVKESKEKARYDQTERERDHRQTGTFISLWFGLWNVFPDLLSE